MAQVKLTVPDEVFQVYEAYNAANPKLAMEQALLRFKGIRPTSRIIVLPEKERAQLEALFDRHLETAQELVAVVKHALTVKVEGFEVSLNPNQLERLRAQAQFEGRPFEQFAQEKVQEGCRYVIDG